MTAQTFDETRHPRDPSGQFTTKPASESEVSLEDGRRTGLRVQEHSLTDPRDVTALESTVAELGSAGVSGTVSCEVTRFDDDRVEIFVDDDELGAVSVVGGRDPGSGGGSAVHGETGLYCYTSGGSMAGSYAAMRDDVRDHRALRSSVESLVGPGRTVSVDGDTVTVTADDGRAVSLASIGVGRQGAALEVRLPDERLAEADWDATTGTLDQARDSDPAGTHRQVDEVLGREGALTQVLSAVPEARYPSDEATPAQ